MVGKGKMGTQTWTLARDTGRGWAKLLAQRKWGLWPVHFLSQVPREEFPRGRFRTLVKTSKANSSWVETNCSPWGGGLLALEARGAADLSSRTQIASRPYLCPAFPRGNI